MGEREVSSVNQTRQLCLGKTRHPGSTHNNTGQALLGVAVTLQLLRDGNEDTGGQSHVENAVGLLSLAAGLNLLKVLVKVDERVILIVLAGNVGAEGAELV